MGEKRGEEHRERKRGGAVRDIIERVKKGRKRRRCREGEKG